MCERCMSEATMREGCSCRVRGLAQCEAHAAR